MRDVFYELTSNDILWTAVLAWFIAQLIKFTITLVKSRRPNIYMFVSTGGMPSSHTAFVTAMTTAIGVKQGFDSPLFAISAVVSLVVMTDAAGLRRAAGKQAAAINMLIESLQDQSVQLDKKLKELLGHTPVEVAAGLILGVIVGLTVKI